MAKKKVEEVGDAGKAAKGKKTAHFDRAKYAAAIANIEALAKRAGIALPPGASEKDIAATEAELGVTFPPELRAFYLAHDGGPDSVPVFNGRALLSLKSIVNHWEVWKEVVDAGDAEDDESATPDPGIQQKWWSPAWIPVTTDFGGNNEMVDTAPAKGGKIGQVICVWHDDDSRSIDGEDFLSWLQEQPWGDGEVGEGAGDEDEDEDARDDDAEEEPYDTKATSSAPLQGKAGKYVFLFQLGKGAKVGKQRVPAAFTTAPCYFYRDDHKSLAKHLDAIDEPDVDEDEGELTFSAIEAFVEEHALRRQLYTDAEAETENEYSESHGFHAGASYEEAKAALARGGFRVVDLSRPTGVARDVEEIARRLDMSSTELVIAGLAPDAEGLGDQANAVGWILSAALARDGAAALTAALRIAAPSWTEAERDRLLLIAGHAGREHAREAEDDTAKEAALSGLRKLIAAIPPTKNATVQKQLAAWGLAGGAALPVEKAKPKKR